MLKSPLEASSPRIMRPGGQPEVGKGELKAIFNRSSLPERLRFFENNSEFEPFRVVPLALRLARLPTAVSQNRENQRGLLPVKVRGVRGGRESARHPALAPSPFLSHFLSSFDCKSIYSSGRRAASHPKRNFCSIGPRFQPQALPPSPYGQDSKTCSKGLCTMVLGISPSSGKDSQSLTEYSCA
jgi:hypothetical protein